VTASVGGSAANHAAIRPPDDSRVRSARRSARTRRPGRRVSAVWIYVAVPVVVSACIALYPLIYNIWISLHVDNLGPNDGAFAGLQNYRNVFRFDDLWGVLGITVVWTVGGLIFQSLIGFALALALDLELPGSRIIRALLLSPWVMPGVVVGAIWLTIYQPISGLADKVLGWFGISAVDWLGQKSTALPSLIFANVWKGFPFWMLMIAAALKAVPTELHEAARIDGASYWQRVRHVVLPGIRPVLILTSILAFIWTFNYFDLAYTLTQGGPDGATTTLPFEIYQTSFQFNRLDEGAAQSVLTLILMIVAIGVYMRFVRFDRDD
jgi:multiple sugar transport system permease protein